MAIKATSLIGNIDLQKKDGKEVEEELEALFAKGKVKSYLSSDPRLIIWHTLFPISNLRDLKSDIANVQYSSKNTRKPFCKNPWRVWNEAYPVTQILFTSADLALRHIHSFLFPVNTTRRQISGRTGYHI